MPAPLALRTLTKTLATAGTAEALGTRLVAATSIITVSSQNSGSVFIGASNVDKNTGYLVTPGMPLRLMDIVSSGFTEAFDLSKIFAVSTENNDVVIILFSERSN